MEMDLYGKVSALYSNQDACGGYSSGPYWKAKRRVANGEFGGLFKIACDELKEQSGAHQNGVRTPILSGGFAQPVGLLL